MFFYNVILLSVFYSTQALSTKVSELGPEKVIFDLREVQQLFEDFVTTYNKTYSDEAEYYLRFEKFRNSVIEINKLNDRSGSTVFSINELSDLSPEEIVGNFTMPDVSDETERVDNETIELLRHRSTSDIPKEFDWRKRNVVTPPKNQGRCQSCWAFASVCE